MKQGPREEKFFRALRDLFVGAKVEGESGFINLMRIKSRYYEKGVFPQLSKDIAEALKPFPQFREELFDKLYTFFSRYFSESGSIYFRYTPLHQNVYERVYTDDRDVMLFWKTHMLHYVKTDRLFKSMEVEVDGRKFFFDVSALEHKKANEKRELIYKLKEHRKDGVVVFTVAYSERGRKTKTTDILKALKKSGASITEELLERAFRVFERQSEVDYFINKNAKAFLEEQFDLWMYQYVFKGQTEWDAVRIRQLQVLRDIAFKIIAFISQFEDELVKIWNKPKFVLNSNYVITLSKMVERKGGMAVVEKLLAHDNFKAQVAEWRELGIVDASFKKSQIIEKELTGKRLADRWQHLPVDTKHFKDLELEILGLFDNLDEALDGWLIHSENYQALNTLGLKFREKFQCIYIDPPYNSPATEIMYENKYKSSSWLTLVGDRLELARDIVSDDGVLCIAIDDNEFSRLAHLVAQHFPVSLGVAAVRSNPAGRSAPQGFSLAHEYAVFAAKNEDVSIGRLERTEEQIERYGECDEDGPFEWVNFRKHGGLRAEAPRMFYPIYVTASTLRVPEMAWNEETKTWDVKEKPRSGEIVLWPIDEAGQERRWKWSHERLISNPGESKVDVDRRGQLAVYIKARMSEGVVPSSWWDRKEYSATDYGTRILKNLFGEHGVFSYPKSPYLVEDCLLVANLKKSKLAIDFFAGSGTTAHAVINLNRADGGRRKYILVEMADYFDTVMLPRIKKVVFSDKWKDGRAQDGGKGIAHFAKYYQLEQYEDALRRVKYDDADLFSDPSKDPYHQYVFLRDLKMLHALEVDAKKNKVKVDLSRLYDGIDVAETLSNLTGKWIKRIHPDPDNPSQPAEVEFADGEKVDLKNLDWRLVKPLIWW